MIIPLRGRPRTSDVDMVPMIGFVFLLLIFFLLIGRFGAAEAFSVRPPASRVPNPSEAVSTGLLVSSSGDIAWGRERLSQSEAIHRAARWSGLHPQESVSIKADAALEAIVLIDLLERLQAEGVSRVLLLTTSADVE